MFKIIFVLLINSLFIWLYYFTNDILFLIINQVVISLLATLTDNAVTVNIRNIQSLHSNFEGLLQVITKVINRSKANMGVDWEDMDE